MKRFSTILFVASALVLITFSACNKKAFLKKIVGSWRVDRYIFDGENKTIYFDTTFRNYTLDIQESNTFMETYETYSYANDSIITSDTLGYDSLGMAWVIDYDTLRFLDTTITPFTLAGTWELINSDEDLQLSDTSFDARMYRILSLDKNSLNTRKGNEEFLFSKN